MWSTPSSTARRRTARAAAGSLGGPNTPGPASCIAPKPMRLIGLSPRKVVAFILDPPEFEELETQRFDLGHDAVHRGPILEQAGQHRRAALLLRHHRGKGRQTRGAELALDADRVQARR